jgi:hypothetical protein
MAMGMSIAQIVEIEFGVGRHLYDVKPEWFPKLGKVIDSIIYIGRMRLICSLYRPVYLSKQFLAPAQPSQRSQSA